MPVTRRPQLDDRRRMVIYSRRFASEEAGVAVPSRVDARLREARRPVAAYGWRVQRRLRARWYGLVPVRRRALVGVVTGLLAIVGLLVVGHWAALWWEPIAIRPEVARPLRLDRPDSLGNWVGAMLWIVTAGASLLVYQLRRYRTDDYHGHYRLWRVAILVGLAASIDSVVNLSGWAGGVVDLVLAQRDVLAGADWVRLMVGVAGAAFGLRMIGELSRQRLAAATLVVALGSLALAPAVRWNLVRMEPVTAVTWVPAVLLFGRAMMLVAAVIYLRALYREARKLEQGDGLGERLRKLLPRWQLRRSPREQPPAEAPARRPRRVRKAETPPVEEESTVAPEPRESTEREGWWKRSLRRRRSRTKETAEEVDSDSDANDAVEVDAAETPVESRTRWWSRRRGRKVEADDSQTEVGHSASDASTADDVDDEQAPKRRGVWKILSRSGRRVMDAPAKSDEEHADAEDSNGEDEPKSQRRRFGFSLRRKVSDEADAPAAAEPVERPSSEEKDEKSSRRWLRLPFGRGSAAAEDGADSEDDDPSDREDTRGRAASVGNVRDGGVRGGGSGARPVAPARNPRDDDDEDGDASGSDELIDEDSIDWEGLSKAERRRMRKLIKRQDRAA